MTNPTSDRSPEAPLAAPSPSNDGGRADIDHDSPWPGLASFTERQSELFFGRQEEADELFRLVRRDELTVLHGQSGLGKTSLLQAGLFPRLRQHDFLPVLLRVDYSGQAPRPAEQVKLALAHAFRDCGVDAPLPSADRSLWEYFHDIGTDFWSARNRLLTPVLVFDQFEELFTIGQTDDESRRRGREFVCELASLVENSAPPELAARLESAGNALAGIDLAKRAGKFVITLRSDFLAELESLEPLAHGLTRNRMRLRRMSAAQALQVVIGPGGGLAEPAVARQIVQFVAGEEVPRDAFATDSGAADATSPATDASDEHLEVEPALLSLVCRELNARRQRAGLTTITADLLAGHRQGILTGFYEQCLDRTPLSTRCFIEDRLLTRSGHRSNVAVEDAVAADGVTREDIDRLVFRRLLRTEERLGAMCVELAHDVLTTPVRASRDARRQREALRAAELKAERAAIEARRRRRSQFFITTAALLTIGSLASLAAIAVKQKNGANRNATAARLSQHEAEVAAAVARHRLTDLYVREGWSRVDGGDPARALLYFSRAMTTASSDPAAEANARICFATTLVTVPRIVDLPAEMLLRPWSTSQNRELHIDGNSVTVVDKANRRPLFTIRHKSEVHAASFSPDGLWVVTASQDATAQVWDAATGKSVGETLPHSAPVFFAAFSPDSRKVVTASQDKTARIWDAATGRRLQSPLQHPDFVGGAEFSPDGAQIATCCEDGKVRFWNVETGQEALPQLQHPFGVRTLAYSPDGALLATGSRDAARIWSVADRRLVATLGHEGIVFWVAFSLDGRQLVTGSLDHTARVWDASTGQPAAPILRSVDVVGYVAFSDDGRRVGADLHDRTNRAWDIAGARPAPSKIVHEDTVLSAAFSPDGHWVVTSSDDQTARIWDAATGAPITPPLKHGGIVRTAMFSADGRRVVTSCDDGAARIWIVAGGAPGAAITPLVLKHADAVYCAAFSPDGRRIVTASKDKTARIWDVASGTAVGAPLPHDGAVWCAAFSRDGGRVATGGDDGMARIWNAARGNLLASMKHEDRVYSVAFSPDGTRLVAAGRDQTARVWDAATGAPVSAPLRHKGSVRTAEFSPDGRLVVTASFDRTARVWDAATGQPRTPSLRHADAVRSAVFSPDGTQVVTASDDKSARVWDAAGGLALTAPLRHDGQVWCAEFSPDGRQVVSGGKDNVARIWKIGPDSRPAAELQALAELLSSERVDSADGLEYLTKEQWEATSRNLHQSMPEQFKAAPGEPADLRPAP